MCYLSHANLSKIKIDTNDILQPPYIMAIRELWRHKNKRNTIWRVENRDTLKKKKKTKNLQLSLRESANPSYKEIRFFDGFR